MRAKAVWNFSKNSPVLVALPVPYYPAPQMITQLKTFVF